MTRAPLRPASASALYRALTALDAAPTPDPELRPHGAQRNDAALLLGVLHAKAELDAAVRADPNADRPQQLSQFFTGYRAFLTSPGDQTRAHLLTLRLIRTAIETTLEDENDPLTRAAGAAAMAAAHLLNARQLVTDHAPTPTITAALQAADHALNAATERT